MNQNIGFYQHIYGPIMEKVREWIWYDDHQPKSNYFANREEHDAFRGQYDRDCALTGGELKADTLFSLWLPLRHTITRLNDKEKIRSVGNISRKYDFLRELIKGDNMEKLLPINNPLVQHLSLLFGFGMCRGNVFILPDRQLNCARAQKPYWDYVPVFLLESFPGGKFAHYWDGPEDYLQWIHREHLEMFFEGEISPEHIRDLSGAGDVRVSLAPDGVDAMDRMLNNYVYVLMKREKIYREEMPEYRGWITPAGKPFYEGLQNLTGEEIDMMCSMDDIGIKARENNDIEAMKKFNKECCDRLEASGITLPSFLELDGE